MDLHEKTVIQKRDLINKACDWLEDNSINYVGRDGITNWREIYKDFRQAMEDEQ